MNELDGINLQNTKHHSISMIIFESHAKKRSQQEYCCVASNPWKRPDFCLFLPMIKLIVGLIFLVIPEKKTDPTKSNWDHPTKSDVSWCRGLGLLLGSTHRERRLLALRSRLIQSAISFQESNLRNRPNDLREAQIICALELFIPESEGASEEMINLQKWNEKKVQHNLREEEGVTIKRNFFRTITNFREEADPAYQIKANLQDKQTICAPESFNIPDSEGSNAMAASSTRK